MDSDYVILQVEQGDEHEAIRPEDPENTFELLPNFTIPDSGIDAKDGQDKADAEPMENTSPISSDYEDALSCLTLSPISSTNLSDDPSFRESPSEALETTSIPVQKKKLHFLMADYMLDLVIYTEAYLGYQKLMKQLSRRIGSLHIMAYGERNFYSSEEVFCFGAHKIYEEMTGGALKEMRAQQLQWLLLVKVISKNQFSEAEDLTPSHVFSSLVQRFTQIELGAQYKLKRSCSPTEVFHQFIFRHSLPDAFATIVRWHPFDHSHTQYLEGYGEGLGKTNEESKCISYNEACRDILKKICTKFSTFVEALRGGKLPHTGFEDQFCFVLFQHVSPNTLEYSEQNPTLRFNIKEMDVFSQPISRMIMMRTIEYLEQSNHIPLSKMNAGVENWIPSDHRVMSR